MFSADDMVNAAAQWFGALPSWPDESPAEMVRHLNRHKTDTSAHYGVVGTLLMIAAVDGDIERDDGGGWPPVSPRAFADAVPTHLREQVVRYAQNVILMDARAAPSRLPN